MFELNYTCSGRVLCVNTNATTDAAIKLFKLTSHWDWEHSLCFRWTFFFCPPLLTSLLWSQSRISGDLSDSASWLLLLASACSSCVSLTSWPHHQPQHPRGQGHGAHQVWGWPWWPGPGLGISPVCQLSSYRNLKQSKKKRISVRRGQLLSNPIWPSPDKSWDTPPHWYLIFKHKISCIQLQRTKLFVFQIFNEIFIFCSRCSSWKAIDGGENQIRQLSTTLISPEVSCWIISLF